MDEPAPDSASAAASRETLLRTRIATAVALVALGTVWSWWALADGGYFPTVLLPGGLILCLALAILIGASPRRVRPTVPVVAGFGALLALGAWAALSALWSPTPDIAVGDGQRIAIYAISFLLGAWLCTLLADKAELSLTPVVVAAGVAGIAAAIALLTSDLPRDVLETDGTLDYPLGYRNADAAFFAISFFAALGVAASRSTDWRLRGIALGIATLCLDLVVLCQSRASIGAFPVAALAFVLISPERLRALLWMLVAALPVVGILGPTSDLYGVADEGLRGTLDEMRSAGAAVVWTALVGTAIGLVAAAFEPRIPGLRADRSSNRWVAGGVALSLVAGAALFVVTVNDPVDWAEQRIDEFERGYSSEKLSGPVGRFTVDIGSNRDDLWRVALEDFREQPLLGEGGGGFEYSWLRDRRVDQEARDAHSVELEILSELGLPGFLLFAAALGAACLGIIKARRASLASAALGAAALAAGTYWLLHSSVDWFWPYPAVTAPVMGMLGAACAQAGRSSDIRRAPDPRARGAWLAISALALFGLTLVPPFLSERYIDRAYSGWRVDVAGAYADLDKAQTLNPLSTMPLLARGTIARASGDRQRALTAFREASRQDPEQWATHYLIADLLEETNLQVAREEVATALALNPRELRTQNLAKRLDGQPEE